MALSDFMSVPFLICLGITLILVGVVGIYFTQKMQEQNHKISSMMGLVSTMAEEMNYMRSRLIMASQNNFQQHPGTDINNITPNMTGGQNTDTNDKLIDVSDGEDESDEESDCGEDSDSDEESDCDSDEDSDCDSHKSKTNINILDNVVANINIEDLLDVNNTIKIINFDEALNATTGEDINIENDSESIDDSLGDSDSDSGSDDDSDDDGEKTNNINLTQISNDSQLFNPELLKVIDISTISDESIKEKNDSNIDYKKMSLNKLRDIIISKKLVSDPSKLKKNEMLKLLGSE